MTCKKPYSSFTRHLSRSSGLFSTVFKNSIYIVISFRPNFNIEEEKFKLWTNSKEKSEPSCRCFTNFCLEIEASNQHHALNLIVLMNTSHLTFYPQYQLNGEKMILKNMDNKSGAGLSQEDIFQLCSNMLINSSIAIACGPFLDRDIMHSMDICISGIFYVHNFLMY